MNELSERLQRRWTRELAALGAPAPAIAAAWTALAGHYDASGRHYHTLAHIDTMLVTLERLAPRDRDMTAVRLAAWYHDVIYDPLASDNEAQSAALAAAALEAMGLGHLAPEVSRLILLTQGHDPAPDDAAGCLLVDADLAGLGSRAALYDRYSAAIRREYEAVPEAMYRQGRRAFLRRFLARERIFMTPTMFREGEGQARRNLRRELAALTAGEDDPKDGRSQNNDQ